MIRTGFLALAAALVLCVPAYADATFCLSAAPAGASEQKACWDIPDATLGDLLEAYAASYFPNGVQVSPAVAEVRDAMGTVTTPAAAAVYRAPTATEVLAMMGNGLKDGVLANVQNYKRAKAAAAAAAAVAPISAMARP